MCAVDVSQDIYGSAFKVLQLLKLLGYVLLIIMHGASVVF